MKLIIKFPTRNRPNKFLNVLQKYINYLDDKTTEIIVSCDSDDMSMHEQYIKDFVAQFPNVKLCYGDNKSKVDAVNANLENVEFDVVLLASDDMIPVVKGFDSVIKARMEEHYPDTDGILWFNDGYQRDKLNTLSILGKKYYDRFNYIYHPDYKSVWCDNEFMVVGNMLGRQTYFDEIIIQHQHPDWGFGNTDYVHTNNLINDAHDRNVYSTRISKNFDL